MMLVESEVGRGTQFTVRLPQAEPSAEETVKVEQN